MGTRAKTLGMSLPSCNRLVHQKVVSSLRSMGTTPTEALPSITSPMTRLMWGWRMMVMKGPKYSRVSQKSSSSRSGAKTDMVRALSTAVDAPIRMRHMAAIAAGGNALFCTSVITRRNISASRAGRIGHVPGAVRRLYSPTCCTTPIRSHSKANSWSSIASICWRKATSSGSVRFLLSVLVIDSLIFFAG